jgi:hypothetical protein
VRAVSDGEPLSTPENALDHDDFGLNQSILISMFRSIDIDVMNVIGFKSLALDDEKAALSRGSGLFHA